MERSTRTVFAYNLSLKADERDIFEFFSVAGRVLDVKLITDKNTKRSKGFAYIEYAQQTDVLSAVALTGQLFKGQAMMVKSSEHEKNLAWEAQQQAKQNQAAAAAVLGGAMGGAAISGFGAVPSMPGPPLITGPCKLAVENLNPQVSVLSSAQCLATFPRVSQSLQACLNYEACTASCRVNRELFCQTVKCSSKFVSTISYMDVWSPTLTCPTDSWKVLLIDRNL